MPVRSAFSLADSSRRRRRLAAIRASEATEAIEPTEATQATVVDVVDDDFDRFIEPNPEPHPEPAPLPEPEAASTAEPHAEPALPVEADMLLAFPGTNVEVNIEEMPEVEEAEVETGAGSLDLQPPPDVEGLAVIRRLVEATRPATWVFCGDGAANAAFPERFAVEVHETLGRPLDVVVNTMIPGGRIASLVENLEWQVTRFHPDVVQVFAGGPDSTDDPTAFAGALGELIDRLLAESVTVVLHTPLQLPADVASEESHANLLACVAQIRGLARDRGLPLVDHFAVGEVVGDGGDDAMVTRLCGALGL